MANVDSPLEKRGEGYQLSGTDSFAGADDLKLGRIRESHDESVAAQGGDAQEASDSGPNYRSDKVVANRSKGFRF